MFAVVQAPAPAVVEHADHQPSKKKLRRKRQRALAGVDEDGDILPLELAGRQFKDYRERLWNRDPRCIFCRRKLKLEESTLDHAFPVSQGGLDAPWNLWIACSLCNRSKGNRSALQWLRDLLDACNEMGLIEDEKSISATIQERDRMTTTNFFPTAGRFSTKTWGQMLGTNTDTVNRLIQERSIPHLTSKGEKFIDARDFWAAMEKTTPPAK